MNKFQTFFNFKQKNNINMKKLKLIPILIIIMCFNLQSQENNKQFTDTLNLPIMDIIPHKIEMKATTERFLQTTIKVLNRGSGLMEIKNVPASCFCGTARVLNNTIEPLGIGKIELSVNRDAMDKKENTLEFYIESNAKNSPVVFKFVVIQEKTDSTKIK